MFKWPNVKRGGGGGSSRAGKGAAKMKEVPCSPGEFWVTKERKNLQLYLIPIAAQLS